MSLVSPYKDVEESTRVSVNPFQLNSDIKRNIKLNLKIQNDLSYSSDSESDKSRPSSPSDSPMNKKDFCDTCNKK